MTFCSSIADDLFHQSALAAYLEIANERQAWPDSDAVKYRAYEIYEAELARFKREQAA